MAKYSRDAHLKIISSWKIRLFQLVATYCYMLINYLT